MVSDEEGTSVPGGAVTATANYSTFVNASASASGTGITANAATDFSGGGGAVSAGGGFEQLFAIQNNPSNATIPLTFNFEVGGLILLTSGQYQGNSAAASVEALVSAGGNESVGSFTLESIAGAAPVLVSTSLWTVTPDPNNVNRTGVSGLFSVTAYASHSVVAQASLALGGEVTNGYTYDSVYLDLASVTVPANYGGPLPVLYGPDGTVIPVEFSNIDEPSTLGVCLIGIIVLMTLVMARWSRARIEPGYFGAVAQEPPALCARCIRPQVAAHASNRRL
jgi:hypothetical protein